MTWTEADSVSYQQLAAVAVPDRAEQMATLLTLLPFGVADSATVVELGCGEGRLSEGILTAYPSAQVLALDGSAEMRDQTTQRLAPFRDRATVAAFELERDDWWTQLDGVDAVVSSLALHHLDGAGKRRLFAAIGARLSRRGAVLIADLVEPKRAEALEVFAAGWDAAAERQAQPGLAAALEQFHQTRWNVFRYPDPVDTPSGLFEQLVWLREAGFTVVDCFWLRAGHAVYGGYRSLVREGEPLMCARARMIASSICN